MENDTHRYVIPAEGALVRFPGSMTVLPGTGASVPWIGKEGTYWRRREMQGDVKVIDLVNQVKEGKQ